MAKAFLDPARDVPLRLGRTICMYEGEPYFVSTFGDRARRLGEELPRGVDWTKVTLTPVQDPGNYSRAKVVDYTEDKFSWDIPPLGYVNAKTTCAYVMRSTARIQKRGLAQEGCMIAENDKVLGDFFYTTFMVKMLKNEYPTIQHALRRVVDGEAESMAYHKDVAFECIGGPVVGLKYKGRLVGVRKVEDHFELFNSAETSILKHVIGQTGAKV